jgi:hypothetical protein
MAAQTQDDRDKAKAERLAAQLRANLQRRKQQARARRADDAPAATTPDPVPPQDQTDR